MNANFKHYALWTVIVMLAIALFMLFQNPSQRMTVRDMGYSEFIRQVSDGRVRDVTIAVRAAVTGRKIGPPLYGSMALLGRPRTIARLEAAQELLEP